MNVTERADHKALVEMDKAREGAGEKGCGKLLGWNSNQVCKMVRKDFLSLWLR